MTTLPKVSSADYLRAFIEATPDSPQPQIPRPAESHADRLELLAEFKFSWDEQLGHLFEIPSDPQLWKWLQIAKFDYQLILHALQDLRSRAKNPMGPNDVYGHAIRHFSASLIRRVNGKYGPPPQRKEAA